ncbi:MAG: hypothetical protein RI906_941 [Pseudomonadota bacterium]
MPSLETRVSALESRNARASDPILLMVVPFGIQDKDIRCVRVGEALHRRQADEPLDAFKERLMAGSDVAKVAVWVRDES